MKLFISTVLFEIQPNLTISVTIWEQMIIETGETLEFIVYLIRSCISLLLLSFECSTVPVQKHFNFNLWVQKLAQMKRFCSMKIQTKLMIIGTW